VMEKMPEGLSEVWAADADEVIVDDRDELS
jgi:hypothetical protein